MLVVFGFSPMMGAKFKGSMSPGGASTSDFVKGPPVGSVTFCHCASSTFSAPRWTSALPPDTTPGTRLRIAEVLSGAPVIATWR